MKKLFAVLVFSVLAICMTATATAAQESPYFSSDNLARAEEHDTAHISPERRTEIEAAKEYAYMDLETAPPELREKILRARLTVIYSRSWSADGGIGTIYDENSGEAFVVPQFSQLFPDWDLREIENALKEYDSAEQQTAPKGGDWFAAAYPEENAERQAVVEAAEKYAYMDVDTASPELRDKILKARSIVVFDKNWVYSDGSCFTGGREYFDWDDLQCREKLPLFSELFPGWNLKEIEAAMDDGYDLFLHELLNSGTENSQASLQSANVEIPGGTYRHTIYLRQAEDGKNARCFSNFYHGGSYVKATVNSLASSETCNIGFNNLDTGENLGFATLYPMQYYRYETLKMEPFNCGVRASTYSVPGYATITITHSGVYEVR